MALLKEPITSSGDDLDNLLRTFFQAEMPNPWPGFEVPSRPVLVVLDREVRPARSSRGSLLRSRFALAASIALLVSGPLFLANVFRSQAPSSPISTVDPQATKDNLHTPRYRQKESLLVTPDGVQIRVEFLDDPAAK